MTTGANTEEAVVFKCGFCMCYCFYPMENLHVEQSEHKHRMNFNTMVVKVFAKEVKIYSAKQRNKKKREEEEAEKKDVSI